jgi:hypothetical protein
MIAMLRHIFCLLIVCLLLTTPVYAQTAINATLYPPDTSAFPTISAFLDLHNAQGGFIYGIKSSDIQIFEDDRQVEIKAFKEIRPGVQIVVALNPGHSFMIRNSKGYSRYDIIAATLTSWANSRTGSNLDDLSLIVPDSPGRTHLSNPLDLAQATASYIVNEATASPNLDLVSDAIDLANDPTPRPGMERAILLFTSALESDQSLGIQDLVTRASQNHIRIFIWLVGSPESFTEKNTALLSSLAVQTNGAFITYSTDEMAINLEDYLEPLRSIYTIEYDSPVRESGVHQMFTQVQTGDGLIKTPLQSYEIKLSAPRPVFIMPPPSISRQAPPTEGRLPGEQTSPKDYLPKEMPLKILVEFPDGRPRPLVRSTLYIDRVIAVENQAPPFDQFNWDISKYTQTGQHLMQVEIEDNLGMVGASIETPVDILLPPTRVSLISKLSPYLPLMAGVTAAVAGMLLLFILVLNGKIHPSSHHWLKGIVKTRSGKPDHGVLTTSLDQADPGASHHLPDWSALFQKQSRLNPKVLATLNPAGGSEDHQDLAPITITQEIFIIGRDILQANLVLDDPTIEPIHARIVYVANQDFYITDQGTLAGTWVNYLPVSGEGTRLEHGDLIHFGRVTFHFSQPDHSGLKNIIIQEAFEYDPF